MSRFFTHLRNGQVVIPIELLEQMGLTNGARLSIKCEGGAIILRPITPAFIRALRGATNGAGAVREREHRKDRY